jgi:putative ABC transport system ATP-binding protein
MRLLSALGLGNDTVLAKPVNELSVGQQQRVAAARALLGHPELLIADEPTSSLDADTRTDFLGLLMAECERFQTTVLFVSHDRELGRLFDRRLEMADINRTTQVV